MIAIEAISSLELLSAACAVIGTFCGAIVFFVKVLDSRLARRDVLDSIAARLRPELVFSDSGAILADRGGGAFLSDGKIEVVMGQAIRSQAPVTIIAHLSRHLRLSPILTPLNPDVVRITASRGHGHDWRFDIDYSMTTEDEHEYQRCYRLEFLE